MADDQAGGKHVKTIMVSLQEAFLIVLDAVERQEEVPDKDRLGRSMPGYFVAEHEFIDWDGNTAIDAYWNGTLPRNLIPPYWPQFKARGPAYVRRYTTPPRAMPQRRGQPASVSPARIACVPAVPDLFQLVVLLGDHRSARNKTSEQERRLCFAHKWLKEAMTDGRLIACGIKECSAYLNQNTSYREKIEKNVFEECWVNYCYSAMRARGGRRATKFDGVTVHGVVSYVGIEVKWADLTGAITDTPPIGELCRFPIEYSLDGGWCLAWNDHVIPLSKDVNGTTTKIDDLGRDGTAIRRGLKTYYLVNKHAPNKIDVMLLGKIETDPRATRAKKVNDGDKDAEKIRGDELTVLSDRLFIGSISASTEYGVSLEDANTAAIALLDKYPRVTNGKNPIYDYENSDVRKGIEAAEVFIREFSANKLGKQVGDEIIRRLRARFHREGGFCWVE